ncbi:MAG: hypothetical protein AAGG51_25530 [Cyanobacteria bacterium P01_G01_bin.54]
MVKPIGASDNDIGQVSYQGSFYRAFCPLRITLYEEAKVVVERLDKPTLTLIVFPLDASQFA